jgi:Bacterial SH3 domain
LSRRQPPQRQAGLKAKDKELLPDAHFGTARIAHRFAFRPQPAARPSDQQIDDPAPPPTGPRTRFGWPRMLIPTLILLAVLPNLTVAAFMGLPAIHAYWSPPMTPAPKTADAATALASEGQPEPVPAIRPVLTAPATVVARTNEDIAFPLALDGTDGVPARSSIAISGLPAGAKLSNGRPYGETEWNLKSDEIGDLHLVLPDSANGETKISIQLIAPDGEVLANAETVLKVMINPETASVQPAPVHEPTPTLAGVRPIAIPQDLATKDAEAKPPADEPKPELAALQADPAPQEFATKDTEAKPNRLAAANAADGASGQSASSAAQPATDGGDANSIEPSDFVNLRSGPSSSSAIIGVIDKGTKLKVMDRKRGWLKVTNPTTSESGWIYSGYVAGLANSGHRRKRTPQADSDDSYWTQLGHWLSGS